MAQISGSTGGAHALSTAQTGNADSTNVLFRKYCGKGPWGLVITTTVGGTPTVTVNLKGSSDGTNYYNVPYALVATPSTFVITALTITTAVSTTYLMQPDQSYQYFKLVYSANTNVTITATAYP
jgi:hypothetical protein